jgi:beta-ketodecanoyl-[acyl-carrier-protein] synthase
MPSSRFRPQVLVINPELTSPQVNYTDRDSHFIFGDVSTAVVLERAETGVGDRTAMGARQLAKTLYSNNIRSNFGYVAHAEDVDPFGPPNLFHQNGRRVFKEVCPMAAEHLERQIESVGLASPTCGAGGCTRPTEHESAHRAAAARPTMPAEAAPIVLDEFANTASAGLHHRLLPPSR